MPQGRLRRLQGIVGLPQALKLVSLPPLSPATTCHPGMIPMRAVAARSGMSREMFRAAGAWLGHRRGGLALATFASCAAVPGSSIATAGPVAKVVLPGMGRGLFRHRLLGRDRGGRDGRHPDPAPDLRHHHRAGLRQGLIAGPVPGLPVGLCMRAVSFLALLRRDAMPLGPLRGRAVPGDPAPLPAMSR